MVRGFPQIGDVLLTTEAPLGNTARLDRADVAVAQRLITLRGKDGILDTGYLYYYLRSTKGQGKLREKQTGTTVLGIKQEAFRKIDIDIPPIEVQNEIVRILEPLDEAIKTNKEINNNLLQQLYAVYRQLFAISDSTSVAIGTLSDICSYSQRRVMVDTLTTENYYSTENMLPEKMGATEASSLPTIAQTTKCEPGDVLISNIRPYFKKIVYCQCEGGCSTDVLCFVPKTPEHSPFLFSTLYADHFFDYMVAGSKGTKMPRGDKQQIMSYPIALPSSEHLKKYNAFAKPILMELEMGNQKNKRLSLLRNTLLSKLMSGEIDVSSI